MDKKELIINKYYKIRKQPTKTCKSKAFNYYLTEGDVRISIIDLYDNVKKELSEAGLKSISMTSLTRLIKDKTPLSTDPVEIKEPEPIIPEPVNTLEVKKRKPRSDRGKTRIAAPNVLKLKCI